MAPRILSNWAEAFLDYTSGIPSPEIYRRWTAYNILTGALERRVWTKISGNFLFPNMLILLVGPPGVGKTQSVKEAADLWGATGLFNIAPSGMTKASFVDQLKVKMRTFEYKNVVSMYNPMLVAATEFGTLLPDYDPRFLNVINDVYDCLPFFEESTRGGGLVHIDKPHINLIAGTQPQYLGDTLPEAAYGMGFMTRLIMVYAGERVIIDMFKAKGRSESARSNLVADLIKIGKLNGEFSWDSAAEEFVEHWNRNVVDDAPTHGKLLNYNTRRIIHAVKLAMAMSISRDNELVVTLDDVQAARIMLVEAEHLMPEIFKAMAVSTDASELREMHVFLFSYCRDFEVETVPEHKLIHFISQRVPVNKIKYFIDTLIDSKAMVAEGLNLRGKLKYRPLATKLYGK